MPKRITDVELSELKKWLQAQDININKIHREFSDAVALANLLKKFYPKLIDLHNYPARNNTLLKLNNWETLNHKVLSKIGLQQNKQSLENLAKGTAGAIEALLYDIMQQERNTQNKEDQVKTEQEVIWSENDDVMMITVTKKIGDAIVQVPQKMILYSIYEQTLRESNGKDAYMAAAQQKIAHLENIIKLKADRIDELCAQLAKLSVRTLMKQHNLENSNPNSTLHLDHNENAEQANNNKNKDFC